MSGTAKSVIALFVVLIFAASVNASEYSRNQFGSWEDTNNDCLNTRQSLLIALSLRAVDLTNNGCLVVRGQWRDPYTDQVFTTARKLDIDHLVPLSWAWDHGADNWTRDERISFANDIRFLQPVKLNENRSKGNKWPGEWLPSSERYRCQYVLRFKRAIMVYDFALTQDEADQLQDVLVEVCGPKSTSPSS